jgi:adenosylmethionine---8-amino-7-oxononanoate aminotransferase
MSSSSTTDLDRATLEAWDDAHVWHPFTPHTVYRDEEPLLVAAGEGNYLVDVEGRRYLDGVSSIWCNTFGHQHPRINAAIVEQLNTIAHATMLGNATVPAIKLARRLVELAPEGLSRVFYSDNGSTATEIALKMAYQYWQQAEGGAHKQRKRFLALGNGYNGDTVGAVSVGGVDLFHATFKGLLFDVLRAPSPYCYRCPLGKSPESCQTACLDVLVRMIEEHAHELAAVILEPGLQGAGGMITYPPGFLRRVREVTRAHDVFLILDEVAVGMGRTGAMFACEREGVAPDFLCLAKMLTGGYLPLSVTMTTERVFEGFLGAPAEARTFFHGHTFTGNPLAAAAALAVLDIFEEERVLEGLEGKIAHLTAQLDRLRALPQVGDIRQIGLAVGIELVQDRATREPYPSERRVGMKICRAARDKGVFLRPLGDTLTLMPPLSVTPDELTLLVDALEHGIKEVL